MTLAAATSHRRPLSSLQILRGLAAIAVAFYHAQIILAQPEYGGRSILEGIATKGWLGVSFFFVLSGFIIFYAHVDDIGLPSRLGRYIWRRFSRVYPVYWVYLTGYIAAAAVGIGHPDFSWDTLNLATAYSLVLLVPVPTFPLQPAWTLIYEICFYGAFALLIVNRRLGTGIFILWIAGIFYNSLVLRNGLLGPLHMWNIYFLFGAAAFFLFRRVPTRYGPLILGSGLILLCALLAIGVVDDKLARANVQPIALLAITVPFAAILLGSVLTESGSQWQASGLLMLLGNASYSVYLVHSPVMSVLATLEHHFLPSVLPAWASYAALVLLSVTAGVIAHLLVECPLLGALRGAAKAHNERRGAPRFV